MEYRMIVVHLSVSNRACRTEILNVLTIWQTVLGQIQTFGRDFGSKWQSDSLLQGLAHHLHIIV